MSKTPDIFGRMWPTPFATYDPDGSCWRTSEATLFSDSPVFSETFPSWGMTSGGDAFELRMSERPTVASDCSSLPAAHEPGGTAERYHARLKAHDGRELTFLPLSMAVQLLPTPVSRDWKGQNQRNDATCLPGAVQLLPTPRTSDANGAGSHGTGGPDLRTVISALTPKQSPDGSVSLDDPPPTQSMTGDD